MAATATQLLALADVRDTAAQVLAPQTEDDPQVFADPVDSLTPPVLMLRWDGPWLAPDMPPRGATLGGPRAWIARLGVVCVAARLEPGPGYRVLDGLVAYTIGRLRDDPSYSWPLDSVGMENQVDQSGITYL